MAYVYSFRALDGRIYYTGFHTNDLGLEIQIKQLIGRYSCVYDINVDPSQIVMIPTQGDKTPILLKRVKYTNQDVMYFTLVDAVTSV